MTSPLWRCQATADVPENWCLGLALQQCGRWLRRAWRTDYFVSQLETLGFCMHWRVICEHLTGCRVLLCTVKGQMPHLQAAKFLVRVGPEENAFYLSHVIHSFAYKLTFQREMNQMVFRRNIILSWNLWNNEKYSQVQKRTSPKNRGIKRKQTKVCRNMVCYIQRIKDVHLNSLQNEIFENDNGMH